MADSTTKHAGTDSIDTRSVLKQLDRIMVSRGFRGAPKLSAFLEFVVEETLSGHAKNVSGREIAVRVFNRGSEFRPTEDAIVRTTANRLRRSLELYYATDGILDEIIIQLKPGSYRPEISVRSAGDGVRKSPGLVAADRYQAEATPSAHQRALRAVLGELRVKPEDPELLAACADLRLDAYKHGLELSGPGLEAACRMVEAATLAAPENARVLCASAFVALELGKLTEVARIGRILLEGAGEQDSFCTIGAWFIEIAGDDHLQMDGFNPASGREEDLPGWVYLAGYLSAYEQRDFETALGKAIDFGMPNFFWGAVCRASVLGQLGHEKIAAREIERLKTQNPHFARNPQKFLRCYIPRPDTRAHILEGLHRAGLQTAN